ncbi:substrate-binding domain-containing protein [Nostoc sp.]|uniref:substrate-binding domain-containing protein n=1 Tax=Nostoc sp. TaxID=1180 RepID=UPI002FFC0332
MKKHFFAFSLIACAVGVTLPTQAFAVKLYAAGSLRDSLTEVAESFNEKYGIPVETRFGPSGLTREFIEQEFPKLENPQMFLLVQILITLRHCLKKV